jgi:peptide-methionine (S)-S-oxide reductase
VSGRARGGIALISLLVSAYAAAAGDLPKLPVPAPGQAVATFAGGCFWCMEPPFDKQGGVLSTSSGYTGGTKQDPSYEEVSAGGTGHLESVQIVYDPKRVSYEKLLEIYWHNIDPTDDSGQFCDKGGQYRSAIFVHDEEQRKLAEASRSALEASHRLSSRVVTEIRPAGVFYPAEEYHQDYYVKNPIRYRFYRASCGRDAVLGRLWGEKR